MPGHPLRQVRDVRLWILTALALPEWYLCRKLLSAGRLDAAIRLTGQPRLLRWMPQVAVMRCRAARERGRPDLIRETAAAVAPLRMLPAARFDIVRSLVRLGEGDAAHTVLVGDPGVRSAPAWGHTVKAVLNATRDADRREALRALVDEATRGGSDIKPVPSTIPFAPRGPTGRGRLQPMGAIDLVPTPRLPARHIERLRAEEERTRRRLARPAMPALQEYRGVFVDGFGQIWTEQGAIIRTYGEPIPAVRRGDVPEVAVACHVLSRTVGIYHWLVDRVPTLAWMLRPDAPDAAILLSDDAPAFEHETLVLAGLADRAQRFKTAVYADRLIIGRVGFPGLRHTRLVGPIVNRIRERALARAAVEGVVLPERVYISRRDASRRRMVNEPEVEALAGRLGYEPVLMSRIPLWHQIALAGRAKALLAPHGAGLAHSLFATTDALVQEIMPITDASYALRFNYARLAMVRGVPYRALVDSQPAAAHEWSVDFPAFEAFMKDGPPT